MKRRELKIVVGKDLTKLSRFLKRMTSEGSSLLDVRKFSRCPRGESMNKTAHHKRKHLRGVQS